MFVSKMNDDNDNDDDDDEEVAHDDDDGSQYTNVFSMVQHGYLLTLSPQFTQVKEVATMRRKQLPMTMTMITVTSRTGSSHNSSNIHHLPKSSQ